MTQLIGVGEPAASSLSSCLSAFPGGFSLLTETGRLRAYLIGTTFNNGTSTRTSIDEQEQLQHRQKGSCLATAVATAPVQLNAPPPQGSFPVESDVPVDHTWSQDGQVLVVLRRFGFTVYWRNVRSFYTASTTPDVCGKGTVFCSGRHQGPTTDTSHDYQRTGDGKRGSPTTPAAAAAREEEIGAGNVSGSDVPLLGLVEMYSGKNGSEGKVVACGLLGADAAGSSNEKGLGANTYLIAVGGAFGVECHALDALGSPPRASKETSAKKGQRQQQGQQQWSRREGDTKTARSHGFSERKGEGQGSSPPTAPGATCRSLSSLFLGYRVVALAIAPDSGLMAAAAMTGHVKVWDVNLISPVELPPLAHPTRKQPAGRGGRGRGKTIAWDAPSKAPTSTKLSRQEEDFDAAAAVWGVPLSMARATSLAFSPHNCGTFALACWDGKVAIFAPTMAGDAISKPDQNSTDKPGDKRGGDGEKRREWKYVWREEAAAPIKLIGRSGGKGGTSLEDQDGAFLSWCSQVSADPSDSPADLAISTYSVAAEGYMRLNRKHDDGAAPSEYLEKSPKAIEEPPKSSGVSLEKEREPLNELKSWELSKGPGFELFAEKGLGERVGGVASGSRPPGTTEPTAERYLIHGLAAGSNFVALYDSDLCLHVVSLAAVLSAGCILSPSPKDRIITAETVTELKRQTFPILRDADITSSRPEDLNITPLGSRDEGKTSPGSGDADETSPGPADEDKISPLSLETKKVTLVSNDHGLVVAEEECRRHCGPGGGGVDHAPSPPEGLALSITWRDAFTGAETLDNGECAGGEQNGSYGDRRQLPFLPGRLADDGTDEESDGVFGADVRWGHLALFTRYMALVYKRSNVRKDGSSDSEGGAGVEISSTNAAGGWKLYPEYPIVHGVLFGGMSTATPLSERLPAALTDLSELYLLAVLETDEGDGYSVTVRSLRDRTVTCRCPILIGSSGSSIAAGDEEAASVAMQGMKVYVSPGYGGGVFVVANEGAPEECAKVWRGTFDEAAVRLELAPPRVITSSPWPEPDTLRLVGVGGPNCELFMFKEVEIEDDRPGKNADSPEIVRWWVTWPEAEIWKNVDAPKLLGGEDLGVSDFVKIFQIAVEEMLASRSTADSPCS